MDTDYLYHTIHEAVWPSSNSQIPQVRIEVNFKCGKACFYCRPTGEGVSIDEIKQIATRPVAEMTTDEIVEVVTALVKHGVTDFKLTGGDPMLRPDIVNVVKRLKAISGVASLHLVTRHHRAGKLAPLLKDAGLDLLNFSLDSLNAATWTKITRVKGHESLIEAIRAAVRTGIRIKLNTVILKGVNDQEIEPLTEFAGEIGAELKLLDLINDIGVFPGFDQNFADNYYADLVPVTHWLAGKAKKVEVVTQAGGLGHPMPRFQMLNGATVTVKSAKFGAYYGSICKSCAFYPCWDALMALRVTPNGMLQYCLLRSDNLVDLLGILHGPSPSDADAIVERVLNVYRTAVPFKGSEIQRMRSIVR